VIAESAMAGEARNLPQKALAQNELAQQEEDLLETAVREHARLVYRIAYSVLRNPADAEDATQETFLRALRCGERIAGVQDQKAWLARIAWRVAVDREKTRRKSLAIDIDITGTEERGESLVAPARGQIKLCWSRNAAQFWSVSLRHCPLHCGTRWCSRRWKRLLHAK
jgi:DNA-directed RNA polymerase specialized sigma24 family protein